MERIKEMTTLLVAIGALIAAVMGRAALDPQPIVHAQTALIAVSASASPPGVG